MEYHRSSKSQRMWIIRIGLIGIILLTACLSSGQVATRVLTTPSAVVLTLQPEKKADEPAQNPTPPKRTPTNTPTATRPAPTQGSVDQDAIPGISFDYQAIPLGQELETNVDGRKFSIKVNKVTSGSEGDQIALSKAPDETQWAIIQLMIKYQEGEKNVRTQLLESSMFHIISKGNLDVGRPLLTFTPTPHLEDVTLLPGEQSLGYLAFQVYRDDPAPLLRFDSAGEEHFFALTDSPVPAAVPEKEIQLARSIKLGTQDLPVPAGTPAYVEYGHVVYKITVQKALRGFNALKKIKDSFGFNDDPPEGKEFLMPYVSISIARAEEVNTYFSLSTFSSLSNQEFLDQPSNFFCPMPCLQSAALYPNGNVSGWIPLLAYQNDQAPLLVFDNKVYFQLVSEQDSEMAYQRQFSPDAIGYPNRDKIKPFLELKQVGPVNAVAFSTDDHLVVTAGDDKTLHVWEISTGTERYTRKNHRGSIKQIQFSADGGLFVSVSNIGEVIIWDTASWEPVHTLDLKGNGLGARFLPDGSLMGASTSGVLQFWDVQSGQPIRQEFVPRSMSPTCAGAAVHSFDASDDGSILAASLSCGFGIVWEQGDPKVQFAISNHQDELKLRGKQIPTTSKIALSPDGKMAAYGMVYHPDWRLMLLNIIDLENKQVVAGVNPIDVNVTVAKVAPNKDLMMSGVGNQVLIWWPEAFVWGGENLMKLTEHKVIVTTLEYSTAGEILASGDYSGKTILWKAK